MPLAPQKTLVHARTFLNGDFNTVAVRVQHYAFIIPVSRKPRFSQHGVTRLPDGFSKHIHIFPAAGTNGKMNKAGMLAQGIIGAGGYTGHFHEFQPGTITERKKIGAEAFCRVMVFFIGHCTEILHIKCFQRFQLPGPDGQVFYFHKRKIVKTKKQAVKKLLAACQPAGKGF